MGAAHPRANTTSAEAAGRGKAGRDARHGHDREAGRHRRPRQHDPGGARHGDGFYRLTGHKWFLSAPMSDAFLVLAQAQEGLSCFLMPRLLPRRRAQCDPLQRLKDKLGNRSNASSEVEFDGAIGVAGRRARARGIATIIDMVTLTRLDCAVASAGLMRARLRRSGASCPPPRRRSAAADRPAADAARARRHGARRRGCRRAVASGWPTPSTWRRRPAGGGGLRPADDAGGQILGLQDRAGVALRGDGVPRRQRLCRGERRCRGSIARRRSTPSGKAPATSWRSTWCACWPRAEPARRTCSPTSRTSSARAAQGDDQRARAAACRLPSTDEGSARILTEQLALTAAAAALRRDLPPAVSPTPSSRPGSAGQWRATYGMLDARHDARLIIDTLYPAM